LFQLVPTAPLLRSVVTVFLIAQNERSID